MMKDKSFWKPQQMKGSNPKSRELKKLAKPIKHDRKMAEWLTY